MTSAVSGKIKKTLGVLVLLSCFVSCKVNDSSMVNSSSDESISFTSSVADVSLMSSSDESSSFISRISFGSDTTSISVSISDSSSNESLVSTSDRNMETPWI